MNRKNFETIMVGALVAASAFAILLRSPDRAQPETTRPQKRARSKAGRCPICKCFVKKAKTGDSIVCSRCGANLRQESTDVIVHDV